MDHSTSTKLLMGIILGESDVCMLFAMFQTEKHIAFSSASTH